MNLGMILRNEGITPRMIEKNRSLLIKVMKESLDHEASIANSFNGSYQTALEYPIAGSDTEVRNRSVPHNQENFSVESCTISERDSATLFGSAPPSVTAFSSGFLQRYSMDADPLNTMQMSRVGSAPY